MSPRKKVAIVGFSSSSRHLAPWTDPEWELWGMNQAYMHFQRDPDRWFELHAPDAQADVAEPNYHERLKGMKCPVYMLEVDPKVPSSVRYPIEKVTALTGRKYFTSSAAYMVALAILEKAEEIALFGVDCTIGEEYEYQKACLEYWTGIAIGRGIKATIPDTSALLKAPFIYGYEPIKKWPRQFVITDEFIAERIAQHKTLHNEYLETCHKLQGAILELEELNNFATATSRGSQFKTLSGEQKEPA